jgi:predicted nucleic acid-binding Zn ribbon protein
VSSEGPEPAAAGLFPPTPARADESTPLRQVVDLTSPDRVAAAALGRAKAAAQSRGIRPGQAPTRRPVFEVQLSSAGAGVRDPRPVGDVVGTVLAQLGSPAERIGGSIKHRWPELVGAGIAEHCEFVSFEGGALTVRASSTTWATQLRLLAPTMLARFGADLGEGVVLEITVLGPGGPRFARGPKSVRGRGERDTFG